LSEGRVLGCLLGGALGDALGYPIEFEKSSDAIHRTYGREAPVRLGYAGEALISDDTQMTLFSAEALIRARGAPAQVVTQFALGAYQRWLSTQELAPPGGLRPRQGQGLLLREARLFARRAPGNTCMSALALSFTRDRTASVVDPPNDSKGCGAVMRAAPFGLAAPDRETAFALGRDTSALTHGHPSGYLSAAFLAALIHDLARGVALSPALSNARALLMLEPQHEEVARAVAAALELASAGPPSASALEALGGGWVGEEALAIALACALTANPQKLSDALWRAVAHGGDSDSTGSIAGNVLGALHGIEALPQAWLRELDLADVTERVARDLYCATLNPESAPLDDYPRESAVWKVPRLPAC